MQTADLDYHLPDSSIARFPASPRDSARLCVVEGISGPTIDTHVSHLSEYLRPGDVLVRNTTDILAARLLPHEGGEIFLLEPSSADPSHWWALTRPARRYTQGSLWSVGGAMLEIVEDTPPAGFPPGARLVRTTDPALSLQDIARDQGHVPLPPYMSRSARASDTADYRPVFASDDPSQQRSVAAPTASLHFTESLLASLASQGVLFADITLHVGLGTFLPIKAPQLQDHTMHHEQYHMSPQTALELNSARQQHRRIIALGTTALRTLETCWDSGTQSFLSASGSTDIFLYPPYESVADGLLTNFHQPQSTLLALVAGFIDPGGTRGLERVLSVYQHALEEDYRFLSYGDATLWWKSPTPPRGI